MAPLIRRLWQPLQVWAFGCRCGNEACKRAESGILDWHGAVLDLMSNRSFSSLWYWIMLIAAWFRCAHWVLGVPYSMIARAELNGRQAEADLDHLARINRGRILLFERVFGFWFLGAACALLTTLGLLGFLYWLEFAQAAFLLAFPLFIAYALNLGAARRIEASGAKGQALRRMMRRHWLHIQLVGYSALIAAAVLSAYWNTAARVLSG